MPVALESAAQVYERLRRSGIIGPARLQALIPNPAAIPNDPKQFLGTLVARGYLTRFQADQLLQGRHRGFRLGAYLIQAELGRGGMGVVYLAEHQELHRKVALKVLLKAKDTDHNLALERFVREARAAAALDHPNIVRIHDVSRTEGVHFLVLEHVEGETLQQLLDRSGAMPFAVAADLIAQAAAGLQHAHEKGFVHRDIKPANLMLDRDGVVKILDMGLAQSAIDQRDKVTERLDQGAVVGTADYISPEQARQSSTVDIRGDIYSLGATFFALVTGKPPFAGNTVQKLMQHQVRDVPSLSEYDDTLPDELIRAAAIMMAKRPEDRYQTPAEVIAALIPWVANTSRVLAGMCSTNVGSSGNLMGTIDRMTAGRSGVRPRTPSDSSVNPAHPDRETGTLVGSATTREAPRPRKLEQAPWATKKLVAIAVVGIVLSVGAAWAFSGQLGAGRIGASAPAEKVPGPVISPAEAAQKVGDRVTVQFTVASTGGQTNLYLNSDKDFKAKDNFAIMLAPRVRVGKWEKVPGDSFVGKTVRATGVVKLNRESPLVEVTDPALLEIVGE